jgi:hypothetical protein
LRLGCCLVPLPAPHPLLLSVLLPSTLLLHPALPAGPQQAPQAASGALLSQHTAGQVCTAAAQGVLA